MSSADPSYPAGVTDQNIDRLQAEFNGSLPAEPDENRAYDRWVQRELDEGRHDER